MRSVPLSHATLGKRDERHLSAEQSAPGVGLDTLDNTERGIVAVGHVQAGHRLRP
ncbi:MAG TPA: hypothetical protein VF223_29255 [Trebonia sp.]